MSGIGDKVGDIVKKVQSDPKLMEKFKENPTKALEEITGKDLPDDQINGVIESVKGKIDLGSIGDKVSGIFKK